MDDEATRAAVPAEVVVEELVTLVLDHLVPAVGWYRDQVAHRLGLSPAALTVLEQAGRRPTTVSRCAGWTGMTPSAMTKVVRRLETAGHVVRSPSGRHGQELFVELVPHPERDRLAAQLRENVRWSMRHLVATLGLTDPDRHRVAANAVVHATTALSARADQLARQEGDRRLLVRRRKARAVGGGRG